MSKLISLEIYKEHLMIRNRGLWTEYETCQLTAYASGCNGEIGNYSSDVIVFVFREGSWIDIWSFIRKAALKFEALSFVALGPNNHIQKFSVEEGVLTMKLF